ncbi:MAG: hypothetical protein HN348_13375 [Proteobacteria bacterium]|jgi:hypothetical protein|nr:hypothetical protein [Pseudomonadota bacterium]
MSFFPVFLAVFATAALGGTSLHFDGVDDHVAMGEAAGLGAEIFTVECWFRWDGEGNDAASSGTGGVDFYPLVGKGRGESDDGPEDMNYGLGIGLDGVLVADFEDYDSGDNHPVHGVTDVRDGLWHHGAVTYDGQKWAIYLDGLLDVELSTDGAQPRYDSEQHFAVGTAMNTNGTADGRFRGAIDEVRLWSVALSQAEIQANVNQALTSGNGLLARWGFDEGLGAVANDSVGGIDGEIDGAAWVADAPFNVNLPPFAPSLVQPLDEAEEVTTPLLSVEVDDPEGDMLEVTFYGRLYTEPKPDFTIIALPDSQYYCSHRYDGESEMFYAQTNWIVEQQDALNIVYVAHEGDLVDRGDSYESEWVIADEAMSILEDPKTTGLADGIPYGIAPGNHDQSPNGDPEGTTDYFNEYFGVDRFEGRQYYGGSYGSNNDNHYMLFSAGGLDFIAIDLEYDQGQQADDEVMVWADELLDDYSNRRAIIVAHHLLELDGSFSDQGKVVYEAFKHHPNLFMTLCGHLTGEELRVDTYDGNTIYSMMADYQFDGDGGAGWLRVLEFSPSLGQIHVWTYSPWLDEYQTDGASDFYLPYDMETAPYTELGKVEVAAGEVATFAWEGLELQTRYQWYVQADDGLVTKSDVWSFTTGTTLDDPGANNGGNSGRVVAIAKDCQCGSSSTSGGLSLVLLSLGLFAARRLRA